MRLPIAAALTLGVIACGDDTGPPDARNIDGPPAGGTISLSWTISDGETALTCDQVGTTIVAISIIPVDQPFGTNDVLGCSPGMGTTREVAPGLYDVEVSLGGVDAEPVAFEDVEVVSGQETPLGVAAFVVEAVGGFSFRTAAAGGNCTGAGITAVQLDVQQQAGPCVPVTFDIAAGASAPAGTYTTSCDAPAPYPACIAEDQTITATPVLPTGPYRLTITGLVDGAACWSRVAQFDVPAGGAIENLTQQNLTQNPACAP